MDHLHQQDYGLHESGNGLFRFFHSSQMFHAVGTGPRFLPYQTFQQESILGLGLSVSTLLRTLSIRRSLKG